MVNPDKQRKRIVEGKQNQTMEEYAEYLMEILFNSLENHLDFVLTYETRPDERMDTHVFSGKLITPDMLKEFKDHRDKEKNAPRINLEL